MSKSHIGVGDYPSACSLHLGSSLMEKFVCQREYAIRIYERCKDLVTGGKEFTP